MFCNRQLTTTYSMPAMPNHFKSQELVKNTVRLCDTYVT